MHGHMFGGEIIGLVFEAVADVGEAEGEEGNKHEEAEDGGGILELSGVIEEIGGWRWGNEGR